jgi:hypothetical protein
VENVGSFRGRSVSAGTVDQTPPVFADHRKPKKFDQIAPKKNDHSKSGQQPVLTFLKFESDANLRQLKGWSIGHGVRWSVWPAHPSYDNGVDYPII